MSLQLFKKNGKFLMLALDHRGSFKDALKKSGNDYSDNNIKQLKSKIIESVYDQAGGFLIDPEYGLPAYTSLTVHEKPYLLCIEKTGYSTDNRGRVTSLEHTVEDLKSKGAQAIKLLLYVNPSHRSFSKQSQTAKHIYDECKKHNTPLFLELVTYYINEVKKPRVELITRSITGLNSVGVFPDVWKLEFPGSEAGCRVVTDEVGQTPWILLTRGEIYDKFKDQLAVSLQNGASGFLAGRALWGELLTYNSDIERERFLETRLPVRFREIVKLVLNCNVK